MSTQALGKKIDEAVKVLYKGGVIAHATDTCYGFACDIFNKKTVARLYALKKMSHKKPVSILVGDLKTAKKYGIFNKTATNLAKKYWPGALTLVVKRKKSVPTFLNPHISTIGIRVPADAISQTLAQKYKTPLTTTSANITTLPSPYSVAEIKKQFYKKRPTPDFIIDSGTLSEKNLPSTIVDVTKGRPILIRQGSLRLSAKAFSKKV